MFLVAKPAGPTSHDVVDQVRRALGTRRVGHLGTLDPFAEGLLVLVAGRATRLATFAAGWAKAYDGVIRFGVTTDTDDHTGRVLAASEEWRGLGRAAVEQSFAGLRGAQEQRPPAFSAVKIDGVRAHKRARRGETVAPVARPVEVRELELLDWTPPDARFRATVSAGTYIRSLARDAGAALGCGGHLVALRRTAVGPFALADAIAPETVAAGAARDPATLVAGLPRRTLEAAEREAVIHGRSLAASANVGNGESGMVALFDGETLLAVAEWVGDVLKPRVVLDG